MTRGLHRGRRVLGPTAIVALSAAAVAEVGLLYQVTKRYGRALQQLETAQAAAPTQPAPAATDPRAQLFQFGAPPGSVGMNFELPALDGSSHTLAGMGGRRLLLIFISPTCPSSESLLPALAGLPMEPPPDRPRIVLVSSGDPEANRRLVERYGVRHRVLLQERNEVALLYFVSGTPMAYLLDASGVTETNRVEGAQAILGVALATAAGEALPEARTSPADLTAGPVLVPARRGDRLPPFRLPSLDGGELTDAHLLGRRTLLTVFDPRCAPCIDLLPELARLHADDTGPQVVLITRRDPALTRLLTREQPMPYPVALQPHRSYSRRLGVLAAPAACLVGPGGYLESDVAVGQQAVADLARGRGRQSGPRRLATLASLLRQP